MDKTDAYSPKALQGILSVHPFLLSSVSYEYGHFVKKLPRAHESRKLIKMKTIWIHGSPCTNVFKRPSTIVTGIVITLHVCKSNKFKFEFVLLSDDHTHCSNYRQLKIRKARVHMPTAPRCLRQPRTCIDEHTTKKRVERYSIWSKQKKNTKSCNTAHRHAERAWTQVKPLVRREWSSEQAQHASVTRPHAQWQDSCMLKTHDDCLMSRKAMKSGMQKSTIRWSRSLSAKCVAPAIAKTSNKHEHRVPRLLAALTKRATAPPSFTISDSRHLFRSHHEDTQTLRYAIAAEKMSRSNPEIALTVSNPQSALALSWVRSLQTMYLWSRGHWASQKPIP